MTFILSCDQSHQILNEFVALCKETLDFSALFKQKLFGEVKVEKAVGVNIRTKLIVQQDKEVTNSHLVDK